ncbi:hypothetical protein [Glutamicibacter ardleyensis]|uniref:hypothetical protein n=1 Tax=Glutamicibacter ardleyensis TaxID=225894 RepID=UPI003FCFAEB7
MSDASWRKRQPKGQSTGGQYAQGRKSESNVRLGHFAPTPGHLKHKQWVNDYLPNDLQARVERSDEAGLFITTENGLYRIEVKPKTDDSQTWFVGESITEPVPEFEGSSIDDHRYEAHWAYGETLSADVANRLGKHHFRHTTIPAIAPIRNVQMVPGSTIPTAIVQYDSLSDEMPQRNVYPLYALPNGGFSHSVTREYFEALSSDPDYSPGYQSYARRALELDDLHRKNVLPADMVDSAFSRDHETHLRGKAHLDTSGRYLEVKVDDGLTAPYNLLYDSKNEQVSAYYTNGNSSSFLFFPSSPIEGNDLEDLRGISAEGMRELHQKSREKKQHISNAVDAYRKSKES